MEAGLWERARRRARHRSRRPRRAALGELAQWDSSVHPWLEDRAEGSQVLISIHHDATSRLMSTRFVERDNGAENRRAMMAYLRRHGRPLAVYTDHAGHFGQWQSKKSKRIAGIDTLNAANRYLEAHWVPFWNARFAVEPTERHDAHRPLPPRSPGTTTLGSPTTPIPTRPSLAEPGIGTGPPANAMARRRHAPSSTRQRPVDGPAHDRAAGSRSPGRASPSLQSGARPCRTPPAKA